MPDSALPHWPNVNAIVAEAKAWYDQTKVQPAKAEAAAAQQTVNDYLAVSAKGVFAAMWTKLGGHYVDKHSTSRRSDFLSCLVLVVFCIIAWAYHRESERHAVVWLCGIGLFVAFAIVYATAAEIRFRSGKRAAVAEWQRLNNVIPNDDIETKVQMYLETVLTPELDYFRTSKLCMDRNQRLSKLDLSIKDNGEAAPAAQDLATAMNAWQAFTDKRHEQAMRLQAAIEDAAAVTRRAATADATVDEEDFDSEDLRARLRRLLVAMNNIRRLLAHAKNASQTAAGDGGLESAIASDDWRAIVARV